MKPPARAIWIPDDQRGPIQVITLDRRDGGLAALQEMVGGMIESLPWPGDRSDITAFINENGKNERECPLNIRATRLLRSVIYTGDYIAGDLVITGEARDGGLIDLPADITVDVVRTLAEEA